MHTGIMLTMTHRATRLGQLIRERRDSVGMTQEQLVAHAHTTRAHIASIEIGKTRTPPPTVINAIARVLPVTVAELVRAMGYGVEVEDDLMRRAASDEGKFADDIIRFIESRRPPRPPAHEVPSCGGCHQGRAICRLSSIAAASDKMLTRLCARLRYRRPRARRL